MLNLFAINLHRFSSHKALKRENTGNYGYKLSLILISDEFFSIFCHIQYTSCPTNSYSLLVRKDIYVNEHERLSNFHTQTQIKGTVPLLLFYDLVWN